MLLPSHPFRQLWESVIIVVTTFVSIEIPLRMVLGYPVEGWLFNADLVIIFIFSVDIIVNFRSATNIDGRLVRDPGQVARHYLKGWFLLDFLAAFPFDLILHLFFSDLDSGLVRLISPGLLRALRMLRLLRLLRLVRLAQILHKLGHSEALNPAILRLCFFGFWVLLIGHWVGCGWIAIGGVPQSLDLPQKYIRGIYWAFTTLTTVGYGDITPVGPVQTIYAIIIMIVGAGMYGYIIGNVAHLLANIDVAQSHFRQKMDTVNAFLKYRNLPAGLQRRIRNYYTHLWESRLGYDEFTFLKDLPRSLQTEVALALNHEILESMPLLQGAPDRMVRDMVLSLSPMVFTPGDVVFEKGDPGKEMYMISRGKVEVMDGRGDRIATLNEGEIFGEVALLEHTPRNATVRAMEYCDIYSLNREAFDQVLENYPDFAVEVRRTAKNRVGRKGFGPDT